MPNSRNTKSATDATTATPIGGETPPQEDSDFSETLSDIPAHRLADFSSSSSSEEMSLLIALTATTNAAVAAAEAAAAAASATSALAVHLQNLLSSNTNLDVHGTIGGFGSGIQLFNAPPSTTNNRSRTIKIETNIKADQQVKRGDVSALTETKSEIDFTEWSAELNPNVNSNTSVIVVVLRAEGQPGTEGRFSATYQSVTKTKPFTLSNTGEDMAWFEFNI